MRIWESLGGRPQRRRTAEPVAREPVVERPGPEPVAREPVVERPSPEDLTVGPVEPFYPVVRGGALPHDGAWEDAVDEASQESFPASDPPSFTPCKV